MRILEKGDVVDNNGGTPRVVKRKWVKVTWSFPSTTPCLGFEVVVFTGTDPTSNVILGPVQVTNTADRSLIAPITPTVALTNVNAAVRALYA